MEGFRKKSVEALAGVMLVLNGCALPREVGLENTPQTPVTLDTLKKLELVDKQGVPKIDFKKVQFFLADSLNAVKIEKSGGESRSVDVNNTGVVVVKDEKKSPDTLMAQEGTPGTFLDTFKLKDGTICFALKFEEDGDKENGRVLIFGPDETNSLGKFSLVSLEDTISYGEGIFKLEKGKGVGINFIVDQKMLSEKGKSSSLPGVSVVNKNRGSKVGKAQKTKNKVRINRKGNRGE